MFVEFAKTEENTAIKSYTAEHNGNQLEIDIYRHINRDGSDNSAELVCRLNGDKTATFYAKPGSYNEEVALDRAKRHLVSLVIKQSSAAAAALGSISTDAKAAAARRNGRKGGRPRNQ